MPNGAIFIVQGASLAAGFYTPHTLSYAMPAADSIDIDSIDELAVAGPEVAPRTRAFLSRREMDV